MPRGARCPTNSWKGELIGLMLSAAATSSSTGIAFQALSLAMPPLG